MRPSVANFQETQSVTAEVEDQEAVSRHLSDGRRDVRLWPGWISMLLVGTSVFIYHIYVKTSLMNMVS